MPYDNTNDPDLISLSEAVLAAFTPEMYTHLISLFPTPEAYAAVHGRLASGYPAFLKGEPEGVKAFEQDRSAIKQFLTMLLGLARTAAIKDPTVPERLRLNPSHAKNTGATVVLTACRDFMINYDPKGNSYASFSKVPGAKGYQVWTCEGDPSIEANWRLAASSTNSRKTLVPGLNRSQNTWLKIRAMRGKEAGPWSNLVMVAPI